MTAEGAASDYDTDILLLSERQAELLRSRAVNALDWDNLAEEIMAQREELEVAELYGRALYRMPEMIDGVPPLPVPQACPVTLDELLALPPEAA